MAHVNHPPVASDGTAATLQEAPVVITLAASDPDGDPLTYSIVAAPAHGTLSAVTGNQVTYTPSAGYYGQDSFTFAASDSAASLEHRHGDADGGRATDRDQRQRDDTAGYANHDHPYWQRS